MGNPCGSVLMNLDTVLDEGTKITRYRLWSKWGKSWRGYKSRCSRVTRGHPAFFKCSYPTLKGSIIKKTIDHFSTFSALAAGLHQGIPSVVGSLSGFSLATDEVICLFIGCW